MTSSIKLEVHNISQNG